MICIAVGFASPTDNCIITNTTAMSHFLVPCFPQNFVVVVVQRLNCNGVFFSWNRFTIIPSCSFISFIQSFTSQQICSSFFLFFHVHLKGCQFLNYQLCLYEILTKDFCTYLTKLFKHASSRLIKLVIKGSSSLLLLSMLLRTFFKNRIWVCYQKINSILSQFCSCIFNWFFKNIISVLYSHFSFSIHHSISFLLSSIFSLHNLRWFFFVL